MTERGMQQLPSDLTLQAMRSTNGVIHLQTYEVIDHVQDACSIEQEVVHLRRLSKVLASHRQHLKELKELNKDKDKLKSMASTNTLAAAFGAEQPAAPVGPVDRKRKHKSSSKSPSTMLKECKAEKALFECVDDDMDSAIASMKDGIRRMNNKENRVNLLHKMKGSTYKEDEYVAI